MGINRSELWQLDTNYLQFYNYGIDVLNFISINIYYTEPTPSPIQSEYTLINELRIGEDEVNKIEDPTQSNKRTSIHLNYKLS